MFKNVYRFKGNFKSFLFVLATVLIMGFLYYTQLLVNELQRQSREFLTFRIKIFEENINRENVEDVSFFFNEVIQQADYPIIYSDQSNRPLFWRNVNIPETLKAPYPEKVVQKLQKLIKKFDETNKPIPISYQGTILGYYHYGESRIIQRLRWLPYIEIIVVALFILIGYSGFSSIKKSEERLIWVGMAKETAHQLGTPLSSLIGWLEYLKASPEKVREILPEMEHDLERLQKVTNRFSQIGSPPDLRKENLQPIIEEIVHYFQRRLPQNGARVKLRSEINPRLPRVFLNRDLISWVLENLVKNGIDALENGEGEILIRADFLDQRRIFVDVKDTGRGVAARDRKNIFKPGFSSKKRGWGLGLSLAKRIVEEYHGGVLQLKESAAGQGSTFRIVLDIEK